MLNYTYSVISKTIQKKYNLQYISPKNFSKPTSRGVLNPKPTFLVYLGIFPALPDSKDFFLLRKTVGCFWKARSDYKRQRSV